MYQFYYADEGKNNARQDIKLNIRDLFNITAVRPAMWEEHCLECSAPLCFENCLHFSPRSDGRCKRFENGIAVFQHENACCGQGARMKFRKWANMMTVLFPAMLFEEDYKKMQMKNQKKGKRLRRIEQSKLPLAVRWQTIRTTEFLRRRKLRGLKGLENTPDAFLFHGYSYNDEEYRLVIEVYDDHTSVFKTSVLIKKGENIAVIPKAELTVECGKADNLVKIYPENDIPAEIDIYWCDFVKGTPVMAEKPAEKVKCVLWDLDNTLWDGILIETENTESLCIKPNVEVLIKALDERGIIQSVASKNDYENAYPVLEKMGIADYFLYPQINWNPKSGSVKTVAENLNIGIDSLALIDDSAFEREEVRSVLPMVRVYDITEISDLLNQPEFEVPVTEESKNRRNMYRAEEKRNTLKTSSYTDPLEFLRKCNLQLNIFAPSTEAEILRCFELVVRTNQLNMSGNKYSKDEFDEVLNRPNHKSFAFSCKDDFGEYGIVGFGQYKTEDNVLIFTEFAMSCRVAGKCVESALFAELLKRENCEKGVFECVITKKNILLRNTLADVGFSAENQNEQTITFVFTDELNNKDIVKII